MDIQETGKKGIQVSNRGVLPGDGTWTLWYFGFQGTQPNPITWHSTRIVLKDGAFSFLLPEAMASATYYLFLSRNQNGKEESFPQITVTTPSDKIYNDTLALFNDNILSIADKSQFKVIYDTIVNTKNSLVTLATSYAPKADTEKTSLVNAVTTLTNYVTALVPAYTDFTTNTTIDGALLNGYVTDCNLKSIQLQTKINSLAKASSDDLLDPNKLTTNKKKEVKSKRDSIVNEQTKATTGLDAQASSLTVSSATYDGAITALTTYLNGLTATGGWNSTTKDWNDYTTTYDLGTGGGDNLASKFTAIETARIDLIKAIDDARQLAATNAATTVSMQKSAFLDAYGKIIGSNIAAGTVAQSQMAAGLTVPSNVSALPALPNAQYPIGSIVTLTTTGKLYTNKAGAWDATVPAVDITGTLTNAQIADLAATKITGTLADAQVAALSASKVTGTLSDSQLAAIAAAKITGTLTGSQIGAGVVDMTKLATGIRPPRVVSTLPVSPFTGYAQGDTVVLTTDNKLYRFTGTSFVSSVATTDLSGTVTDAQVAGLAASKVTGQLSDSQLAAISASKLTGTLADSQLAGISTSKLIGTVSDAQVAGLAASKVTGTLADSQLAAIAATKITGTIGTSQIAANAVDITKLASGLRPPRVVATLPVSPFTGYTQGDTVVLTTDNKLYRFTGTAFVTSIATTDLSGTISDAQVAGLSASKVTGTLTDAQLAAISAAKITGQITTTQITDDSITTAKVAAGAITATEIAASTITAGQIAAGTITGTQLAAGAVTAGKITAGAIQAADIAAGTITGDRLAANTITATQIAADTITASQIASNAITSNELASGSVTTAKLVANAVTANEIAAATITGSKIAANTISASNLVANTLTANEIAAGAITSSELAAGAVVAGKIAAGTIQAADIATGTITTAKLAVANSENLIPDSNFNIGDLSQWKPWSIPTAISLIASTDVSVPAGASTKNVVEFDHSFAALNNTIAMFTHALPYSSGKDGFYVKPGDSYYVSIDAVKNATFNGALTRVYIYYEKKDGTFTSQYFQFTTTTSWATYEGSFTVPADCVRANLYVYNAANATVTPTGSFFFTNLRCIRKSNAVLIEDGAITANKIAANTITAGQIASGTITSAQLAANTIVAGDIAAGTITATELASGSITTAKLAAGAVTANEIAASTITGAKIAAGTITGSNIAADTITAGQIAAGAIGASEIAAGAVVAGKIAAGTIVAGDIASGTITTTQLAAGAVTAGKIAAGAIQAADIAASTITGAKIAGSTITGSNIAADTITSANILAGTITATELAAATITGSNIAANTITGSNLVANTITAGQIAAGTIGATQIAANAISADKLNVTIGGSNLLYNSTLSSFDSSAQPSLYSVYNNTPAAEPATVSQVSSGGVDNGPFYRISWAVNNTSTKGILTNNGLTSSKYSGTGGVKGGWQANKTYILAFFAKASGTNIGQTMGLGWNTSPTSYNAISNPPLSSVWQLYVFKIVWGASVEASGSVYITIAWTPTQGTLDIDHVSVMLGDTYGGWKPCDDEIRPGSITAKEIAASTITGSLISANTITGSNIAGTTITASNIASGTLTATQIAAGTITVDKLNANCLQTINYTETSGTPTAGAKLDSQGTALKVAAGNLQVGGYTMADPFFRSLNALDGSSTTGKTFYKGSIDNSSTYRSGSPDITKFYVQSAYQQTAAARFMLNLFLRPTALSDNFDAMRYAKIEFYRGNAFGASLIMTAYANLPDRLYANATEGNAANASATSVYFENDTVSGILAANDPRWFLKITIYNAYGPSDTKWFIPASALNTDWTQQLSAPYSGGSGGGTGGGSGGDGSCPAPYTLIDTLAGPVEAKDITVGTSLRTINEFTGEYGTHVVDAVSYETNDIWTLEIEDGRTFDFAPNHRFMTERAWLELQVLSPGDVILGDNPGIVKSVYPKATNTEVVKITVADAHTYQTSGLISHNMKQLTP